MIIIEDVYRRFGKISVLQGASLHIQPGEIFGLLGANGAGKSTLLAILATTMRPSNGKIIVKGLDLNKQKKQIRNIIGYVPQDIALWEELTVKENLRLWSKFLNRTIPEERLIKACEDFTLTNKWNEKVKNLSGGMKRKLNIAVATLHDPDILLMDEPTVGIDLQSKLEINQYMKNLANQGITIVYTTHDVSEIKSLCTRMGVLQNGRFSFIGTISEGYNMLIKESMSLDFKEEEVIYQLLKNR